MTVVLDLSAILVNLLEEPGGDAAGVRITSDGVVSTVSLSEVVAKLAGRGGSDDQIEAVMVQFAGRSHDFDLGQARAASRLRPATRAAGLSPGDRACLALALSRDAPVLTADRAWAALDVGVGVEVEVEVIR